MVHADSGADEGAEKSPWQPSNGTEFMAFCEMFCSRCRKAGDCTIPEDVQMSEQLSEGVPEDYPSEWVVENGGPICTSFDPSFVYVNVEKMIVDRSVESKSDAEE